MLKIYSKEEGKKMVEGEDKLYLLLLYATWSSSYPNDYNLIARLSEEYANKVIFYTANVDMNMQLCYTFRTRIVPYYALFKLGTGSVKSFSGWTGSMHGDDIRFNIDNFIQQNS